MNLINSPWIPVRRQKSRETEYICPWQLTEGHDDNPIVAVDFPRPDLSSGIVIFLIGLFQLAMTPGNDRAWHRKYETPPSAGELKAALEPFMDFFQVDGDGPRCFQDLELPMEAKTYPISSLLIDDPRRGAELNSDLFIKRGQFPQLGVSTTIAALINFQFSTPGFGTGFRTSIRGGGPLNTLLVPDPRNDRLPPSLWRAVWLNVLKKPEVAGLSGNSELQQPEFTFPWLAPTRTSENGIGTYPEHGHSLQMYFSMPSRIRLDIKDLPTGKCPLTLREERLVSSYRTKNLGVNYQGAWQHPLSPHRFDKDGLPIPLHPQPGGLGYRHWLHLTLGSPKGAKDRVQAAAAVRAAQNQWKDQRKTLVWSFGFDTKNAKIRGWYESTMPLLHLDPDRNEVLASRAAALINAAQQICRNLRQSVREAWFRKSMKVSKDGLNNVTQSFWQRTESSFFDHLGREHAFLEQSADEPDRQDWLNNLNNESLRLFDHFAASGNIAFENPKRIAIARRNLVKFNHKKSIKDGLRIRSRAA